jgi:hypothetical protein
MNSEELLEGLEGFTGTEKYHYLATTKNLMFTDGMAYLCENAGCYWLADIIAIGYAINKKIKDNAKFLIWRIRVLEGNKAIIEAFTDCESDGSYSENKRVCLQELAYSDFPIKEYEFYQCENVVLLKGEY